MRNLTDEQIEKIAEIDNLTALGLGTAALGGGIYGVGSSPNLTGAFAKDVIHRGGDLLGRSASSGRLYDLPDAVRTRTVDFSDKMRRAGRLMEKKPGMGGKILKGLGKKGLIAGGALSALGILT